MMSAKLAAAVLMMEVVALMSMMAGMKGEPLRLAGTTASPPVKYRVRQHYFCYRNDVDAGTVNVLMWQAENQIIAWA
jgi:hypothetical protein